MNISSKKQKRLPLKRVLIIACIVLLVVIIGALAYAYKVRLWPFSSSQSSTSKGIDYNAPTKEQSNATGSTKQSGSAETTGSDPSPEPTPSTTPGQKPTVNMTITAANETGGTLYIRTLIETISSSGTCTLSMTGPNSSVYSTTVGVQANPSTSTCQGFNVPVSSLATGKWRIVINYSDSSVQASATKDISIQ